MKNEKLSKFHLRNEFINTKIKVYHLIITKVNLPLYFTLFPTNNYLILNVLTVFLNIWKFLFIFEIFKGVKFSTWKHKFLSLNFISTMSSDEGEYAFSSWSTIVSFEVDGKSESELKEVNVEFDNFLNFKFFNFFK